jgi:hypothetical protein
MPLRQTTLLALALVAASAAQTPPPAAHELQLADPGVNVPLPCGPFGLDCAKTPIAKPDAHPRRARFSRRAKTIALTALGAVIVIAVALLQAAAENPTIK